MHIQVNITQAFKIDSLKNSSVLSSFYNSDLLLHKISYQLVQYVYFI